MGYSFPFAAEQASHYMIERCEQMFMKQEWGSVGCSPCLLNHRGWGMRDVVMVACGTKHTVAVCGRGDVWLWGNNEYGQLGDGTNSNTSVAVTMSGALTNKTVTDITAGISHTCALTSDGTAACWGNNGDGRLGNGTTTKSDTPVAVTMTGALTGKTVDLSRSLCACIDRNNRTYPFSSNRIRDSQGKFLRLFSILMEIQETLICPHLAWIIFHFLQVLKLVVNEQILVLPNQTRGTIKRVKALMATILLRELHEKFPLNGRPQYSPNGKLASHRF
jgi:hypothetical protein